MPDEIVDIVDQNDVVIGQISREEVDEQDLHTFRVVHGFLVNSQGKIWIPRRAATKKTCPNALDYSVAGHVSSGETYDESLVRESMEELNLDLSLVPWRLLGMLMPTPDVNCFQKIYEIQTNVTPLFNPEDFSEGSWWSPKEVVEMIEGGEPAKENIAVVLRKFYF